VTVVDTVPPGLIGKRISAPGWSCRLGLQVSCTRSDPLAAGGDYPSIVLTVKVSPLVPSQPINVATVSGGGDTNSLNNTALDPTTIR
jgi:hypothetical protein